MNPDFKTRLRLYEKGVNVEISTQAVADDRKDIFEKMKNMVEESEKSVKEKFKKETKNFFKKLGSPNRCRTDRDLSTA